MVFFKAHEAAVDSLSRSRLPAPLLEDVADAIHDLADEVEPPVGEYERSGRADRSPTIRLPPDVPMRGPAVKRTAKRTPPIPTPPPTPDVE